MAGILILFGLCVVMAAVSFLAGALPLSMTLSHTQLRLISSIGIGILVGTSLVVIIPEGIEAASLPGEASHLHKVRSLVGRNPWGHGYDWALATRGVSMIDEVKYIHDPEEIIRYWSFENDDAISRRKEKREGTEKSSGSSDGNKHFAIPTFEIGFSLITGFVLMFLIDRLPRHATNSLQSTAQPLHMSLDDLGGDSSPAEEEAEGFLGSMTPTPRRARSLATTTGLVIHAAADGIAMGASATASNLKLGLIIFFAIMIHKAPAAFGLTSVLLKQGLSKRAARGHLIVFSLAAPVGALTTWFMITVLGGQHLEGDSQQWWTGMLLLFSGGTFLYVAMQAMQDDGPSHSHDASNGTNGFAEGHTIAQRKAKGPQMRDTVATMMGMLLPLLTQIGHRH